MGKDYSKLITRLTGIYTIEELAAILRLTSRSISNYKDGTTPNKQAMARIGELEAKLSENGWKKIPVTDYLKAPSTITAEGVLLKVLLQEFADYKAEKEGLNSDRIVKDIENKAKLILTVSHKV